MDIATLRSLPASEQAAILSRLPLDKQQAFAKALKTLLAWERTNRFHLMFPDTGPFRRELYAKHLQCFELGATKRYRAFMGANGVGKTEGLGGFEDTCHLTGLYPKWWKGKRFDRPVTIWIGGDTNETIRESIQPKLLGTNDAIGTGIIPASLLGKPKYISNPVGTVDNIQVKHVSGRWSRIVFKTYKEGRKSWQASDVDFIHLDEEPPWEIYSECVQRFRGRTEDGGILITFTPLSGISETVQMFVPQFMSTYNAEEYEASGRAYVMCAWEDVPHISADERARKLANTLPHEREARSKGYPSLGSGKIYPVAEADIVVPPFLLPRHFVRCYAADFGYGSINRDDGGTAVLWGAWDRENDVVYVYAEYFRAQAEIAANASAIRAKGAWIPGVGDTSGVGRDGDATIDLYQREGLDIQPTDKAVDAGLMQVLDRMQTGRLKIFSTCTRLIEEIRLYRRDEKGRIVKARDHHCDALRYLIRSGLDRAKTQAPDRPQHIPSDDFGL